MNRFEKRKARAPGLRGIIFPVVLFAAVFFVFFWGIGSVSRVTQQEQLKTVEQAINRMTVQCYAIEGSYPPSLSYLEEHYGLQIDHDRYLVAYDSVAENLKPNITVMTKSKSKVGS